MLTGAEIKELRKKKGYTQEQLAAIVGVTRSSVYAWERGTYAPEGKNAVALADALGVDVTLLMPIQQEGPCLLQRMGRVHRHRYEMRDDGTLVPVQLHPLEQFLEDRPDLEIWFRQQAMSCEGQERLTKLLSDLIDRWDAEEGKK